MKLGSRIAGWLVLFGFIALWELLSRSGVISPSTLPAPSAIVHGGWEEAVGDDLIAQTLLTLRHLVYGFALAAAFALPLGFLLGRIPLLHAALEPLIEFLRPMPVIAILPIAMLIFGLGDSMIYSVIAFASGWIMLLHTMDAARSIDPVLIDTGKTFHVSHLRSFATILLPATAPHIFTGIRVSISIAVIITVVVELMSGFAGGLGNFIGELQGALRTPEAYAAIVVVTALGCAVAWVLKWLEDHLLAWHRTQMRRP